MSVHWLRHLDPRSSGAWFGHLLIFALFAAFIYFLFAETAAGQTEPEGVLVLSADFELRRYTVHGFIEARPEESVDACREDSGRRPDPGKISRDSVNLLLLQEINEKKAGGVVSARR